MSVFMVLVHITIFAALAWNAFKVIDTEVYEPDKFITIFAHVFAVMWILERILDGIGAM